MNLSPSLSKQLLKQFIENQNAFPQSEFNQKSQNEGKLENTRKFNWDELFKKLNTDNLPDKSLSNKANTKVEDIIKDFLSNLQIDHSKQIKPNDILDKLLLSNQKEQLMDVIEKALKALKGLPLEKIPLTEKQPLNLQISHKSQNAETNEHHSQSKQLSVQTSTVTIKTMIQTLEELQHILKTQQSQNANKIPEIDYLAHYYKTDQQVKEPVNQSQTDGKNESSSADKKLDLNLANNLKYFKQELQNLMKTMNISQSDGGDLTEKDNSAIKREIIKMIDNFKGNEVFKEVLRNYINQAIKDNKPSADHIIDQIKSNYDDRQFIVFDDGHSGGQVNQSDTIKKTQHIGRMEADGWLKNLKNEVTKMKEFRVDSPNKIQMLVRDGDNFMRFVVNKTSNHTIDVTVSTNNDHIKHKTDVAFQDIRNDMKEKNWDVKLTIKNNNDSNQEEEKQNQEHHHQSQQQQHRGQEEQTFENYEESEEAELSGHY